MEKAKTVDDLLAELADLQGNAEDVIDGLRFYKGEANTPTIRDYNDIAGGSIYNDLQNLIDANFIEQVGREPVGKGGKANVYRLTDKGHAIKGEVGGEETTTVDEVTDLKEQVKEQKETIEQQQETIESMQEELQDLRKLEEDYDAMQNLAAKVKGFFEGENGAPA